MWSLYTGQQPYVLQAGLFMHNALFPHFPQSAPPEYRSLAERCLRGDPHQRPTFPEIKGSLISIFSKDLGPGYNPESDAGTSYNASRPTSPPPPPVEATQGGRTAVGSGAEPTATMSVQDGDQETFTLDDTNGKAGAVCLLSAAVSI